MQSLPPELQTALARFERRWRVVHSLTVVGLLLLIPLTSFLLLALSDRIWATPNWARFLLAVPVPILLVASLTPWVRRWVLQKPGARKIAEVMGRLDRRVGDRLLGAVELSEGTSQVIQDSPALRRAAIEQVARELANVRAEERIDTRLTTKLLVGGVALLLAGFTYLIFAPDAARNSFTRWLRPHQEIERFTFIRFSDFPDVLNVAHGESFGFEGRMEHVRGGALPELDLRSSGTESVTPQVDPDGRVAVSGEGLTQPRTLRMRAGDARTAVQVNPMLRPELVAMAAQIEWPEYLGLEAVEQPMRRRRLEVPVGSSVALRGTVSRDLDAILAEEFESVQITGDHFEMPAILVDTNRTVAFEWVDHVGLRPRSPATVEVIAREDEPPRVALSGLASTIAVLEDEFVNLEVSARDDFGLNRVWTRWRTVGDGPREERVRDTAISGVAGSEELVFSPTRFGFQPGQVIDVVAMAVDAYPGREPSVSSRHRIVVLSKEEHAQMILQQMDNILTELDQTIRDEALALEENRELNARADEDLADDATAEALMDRALDELARAERLMDTQRRMESLIVEATKNDEISDEQIADWTKISQDLLNTALPAMRDAAEALRQAAEASGEPFGDGDDDALAGDPTDGDGAAGEAGDGEAGEGMDGQPGEGEMADAGDGQPGDGEAGEAGEGQPGEGEMADAGEGQAGEPSGGEPGEMGEAGEGGASDPSAGGEMADAQQQDQPQRSPSERREQLEEAIRQQEEALAAMQQGEDDLNESIEQSLSERFVNRLRELARQQQQIGTVMNELLPQTIGLTADQLEGELADRIRQKAEQQGLISRDTRYVYDDMNGFYRRSRQEIIREVTDEMEEARFDQRLPALEDLILRNVIGRTTSESEVWAAYFNHWADMLEGDDEEDSGGEGGDGGGEDEGEDLETLIAMIRARERQERLRRHTRALDESYAENLNYHREAVQLSDQQYEGAMMLQPLENRVRSPEVKNLISMAAGEMMNAGVQLRRPQTDSSTIAIQTTVIELIGNALEQSMGGGGESDPDSGDDQQQQQQEQQQTTQQMIQALMQMMQTVGMQEGEGSTGFGDPGRADHTGPGMRNRAGEDTEARGTAMDPSRWPSSYRNMMDAYYQAMEE